MNKDLQLLIYLILGIIFVLGIGYMCGYVHVITTAQAWTTDMPDLVAMTIDGRVYHYNVMHL